MYYKIISYLSFLLSRFITIAGSCIPIYCNHLLTAISIGGREFIVDFILQGKPVNFLNAIKISLAITETQDPIQGEGNTRTNLKNVVTKA